MVLRNKLEIGQRHVYENGCDDHDDKIDEEDNINGIVSAAPDANNDVKKLGDDG